MSIGLFGSIFGCNLIFLCLFQIKFKASYVFRHGRGLGIRFATNAATDATASLNFKFVTLIS